MAILWDERNAIPKLSGFFFQSLICPRMIGHFSSIPIPSQPPATEIDGVAEAILGFLEGEDRKIPLDIADWSVCSPFQESVLRAEYGIPRGRVSTYKLIAEHVGKQNGARAVGTALARNPFPLIVPCHRAIRSDRHLGGYQGGLKMKRALLEMEGVPFDDADRVVCEDLYFSPAYS